MMALCSMRTKGRCVVVSLCPKVCICTPSGMCGIWINVVVVTTGSSSGGGGAYNSSSYRDDEIMFAGALKLVKNFIMIVKIIILLRKKVINFFCIANFNNNFLLNSWRISVPSSSCPGTSFLVVARH